MDSLFVLQCASVCLTICSNMMNEVASYSSAYYHSAATHRDTHAPLLVTEDSPKNYSEHLGKADCAGRTRVLL